MKNNSTKIFDCFLFHNEYDILELKLHTLFNYIDYFVIGESDKTFTGNPKPLYFKLSKDRFSKYASKIIYVEIDNSPLPLYGSWCWNVEFYQRSALIRGLKNNALENDIIIASDVDEIINPEIIPILLETNDWMSPELDLFYYYINIKSNRKGLGPSIARYGSFRSIEQVRLSVGKNKQIKNGGWHFTFMGGIDKITEKLSSYAESQTNKPELKNSELISYKIANRIDLFNRPDYGFEISDYSDFPESIINYISDHPQLIYYEKDFEKYRSSSYHKIYSSLREDYSKRNLFLKIIKRMYKLYWLYIKKFRY